MKIKKILASFLMTLFILTISFTSVSAKGISLFSTLIINSNQTTYEVEVGQPVNITLSTDYSRPSSLVWSVSPNDFTVSSKVNTKTTSTINYKYVNNTPGQYSYTVTVKNKLLPTTSGSINITINVKQSQNVQPFVYVALGDSIATGTTGLGGAGYEYSYVKKLRDYLQESKVVTFKDLSFDGDQSDQLLNKIINNTEMRTAIQSADLITLVIGGNNIMYAAKYGSTYDFNNINWSVADAGKAKFINDWPLIIDEIKTLNPTAKLITMTMYNPYNVKDSLHTRVNSYLTNNVDGINDIIKKNINKGYLVADVYSKFYPLAQQNNMKSVTHFYDKILFFIPAKDPHPNSYGQNLIFEVHKQVYESYQIN